MGWWDDGWIGMVLGFAWCSWEFRWFQMISAIFTMKIYETILKQNMKPWNKPTSNDKVETTVPETDVDAVSPVGDFTSPPKAAWRASWQWLAAVAFQRWTCSHHHNFFIIVNACWYSVQYSEYFLIFFIMLFGYHMVYGPSFLCFLDFKVGLPLLVGGSVLLKRHVWPWYGIPLNVLGRGPDQRII
jgi:hypothetical protein